MKFISTRALIIYFLLFITFSCSESPTNNGLVSFSFQNKSAATGRISESAAKLLVSIKNAQGVLVHNRLEITLLEVNGEFIGVPLVLDPGTYTLEEFIVLNESNQVIFLSPIEGSELAYLVEKPLSIDFTVEEDKVTNVKPEVISAQGFTAIDFGYTTFGFKIIETIDFLSSTMIYDNQTNNFVLTNYTLTVIGDEIDTLFVGERPDTTTLITVLDDYSSYRVVVSKPNFETTIKDFSNQELKSYENSPLITILFSNGVNNAMLFDGVNDYIDLGNIYDDLALPVTISVWVNLSPSSSGNVGIFDSQDNLNIYNGITFIMSEQHMGITYGDGLGENNSAFRRSKSATIQDTRGQWVNLTAIIKSASDMSLFLNGVNKGGVYEGSSINPLNSNSPNEVAKIGTWYSNNNTYFYKGQLDELRIWNRALSPTEVADIYLKKINNSHPGLIGYWSFNETQGNIVLDKSNNGFHGTIKGDAQRVVSGIPPLN